MTAPAANDDPEPPAALASARTPEAWAEWHAAQGLKISARTIRKRARELGQCLTLGNAMLITPAQMAEIWHAGQPTPRAAPAHDAGDALERARAHLTRAMTADQRQH